ncbi:MAG TPA: 3-isopropylmalate dehydrogenase [Nitrospinae bacterium]|nr:3-isopropylmalate dehydrogenase [Nitrospinota bacterium]
MRDYRIIVIPGDNIGPELIDAALPVLEAVTKADEGFRLTFETHPAGAAHYTEHGVAMSKETIETCRTADSVFKAPVGDPSVRTPEGIEAGLLGGILRSDLDLFANVRPVKLYPGAPTPLSGYEPGGIDYVIVRENTEGLYASRGKGVGGPNAVADTLITTRAGTERVVRFAFELAKKRSGAPADGVQRVTCAEKSNVLRSFALFKEVFLEVAAEYPGIEAETIYPDAAAQALIMNPAHYDVLVMENFIGDILSDLGGGTIGGLGMCPGGNIGDRYSYFEPVHGSAPDIAGQGIANPVSQILAGAMLLDHIGEAAAARLLERAVWKALETGAIPIDRRGRLEKGTMAAAGAIIAQL